jgi:tripartite-type tricarboxylate transporter receptor subunit TctC
MEKLRRAVAAACMLLALSVAAAAQDYPNRPVRLVVPFPPGGINDIVGRVIAQHLGDRLGKQVIVENRGGAGGVVGHEFVANAPKDGHTLLIVSLAGAVNPWLYTLPYDPAKSFAPVAMLVAAPNVVTVNPGLPANRIKELVALAKSKPGGLSFASQGSGSGGHLLGEMLKARTGANMVHIPYRGAGPAALDLATGRVDFFFVSYSSLLSFLQAGKVRVLAVTSPQRVPALPDVPTMAEAGFAGIEIDTWFGLVAPAGTPEAVIGRLNAAFVQAVRAPDVAKQMADQGADAVTSTPAEFAAFIAAQTERVGKIVRTVGVKAE